MNYNNNVLRLKQILDIIESGNLNFEDNKKLYDEGCKLYQECIRYLEDVKLEIEETANGGIENDRY